MTLPAWMNSRNFRTTIRRLGRARRRIQERYDRDAGDSGRRAPAGTATGAAQEE